MPDARVRRGTTAHTTGTLDPTHPVDGTVSRAATGRVTATLTIEEPGA